MLNINVPHDIYYFALAFLMVFFMLALVPAPDRRELFGLSLLWGFGGNLIFVAVFGGLLNLFHWQETPFTFLGSPFVLNLAWSPAIMIYLYFKPEKKSLFWLYLVSFSLVSAGLDAVFNQLGSLVYIAWHPAARFAVAVVWLLAANIHFNYLAKNKITLF